jgi:hypothetical protein
MVMTATDKYCNYALFDVSLPSVVTKEEIQACLESIHSLVQTTTPILNKPILITTNYNYY